MFERSRLQAWVDAQFLPENATLSQRLYYKMTRAWKLRPVIVWGESWADALMGKGMGDWDQKQWRILVETDKDYSVLQHALYMDLAPDSKYPIVIVMVHEGLK